MLQTNDFKHNPELTRTTSENIGMMHYYSAFYTIEEAIQRLEYLMMYEDEAYNWGHRDNILTKYHSEVSIGLAYDGEYLYLVQDFLK